MNSIPRFTSADVLRETERLFGASSVNGIRKLLDVYESEDEHGRARVHMACLRLSKGNIDDLKHYVQQARLDFRDVLYWAEYSCGQPRS